MNKTRLSSKGQVIIPKSSRDAHHVSHATGLLRSGMDFADALHLVCSQNHPFATFDKKLKAKADDAGLDKVHLL